MYPWKLAVTATLALLFAGAPAFAYECEPEPMTYERHVFFFDRTDFYLAQKKANPIMEQIESHEGQIKTTTFDMPSVLTAPSGWASELLDAPALCDWWPRNLAVPLGIAYQAFMGKLTVGGDYGATFNAHDYSAVIAFRWYIPGETLGDPDSLAFIGLEDTHWSWHPGQPIAVDGQEMDVREYAERSGIDTSRVSVIDVFSLQWAQYLRPYPKMPVEYRVGYNMFQSAFSDFFKSEEHHAYPYRWFFEGRAAYEPTPYLSFPITIQLETNGRETPFLGSDRPRNGRETPWMIEVAMETRMSKGGVGGFKLFYRLFGGIDDNAFVSTRFGAWSSSPMIGFGWSGPPLSLFGK